MKQGCHLALVTALILHCNAVHPEQVRLGRLFFTPEQRAALERVSRLPIGLDKVENDHGGEFTLNGEVHRSNGTISRWGNGELIPDTIQLPPGLRVGDRISIGDGSQESILKGGKIELKQRKPNR